jgi:uncharacterized protein (UPF0332 family)
MIETLPEELHEQASLLRLTAGEANLRRSISANYYALFHLPIRDAVRLWRAPEHHAGVARQFDHGRMKQASAALTRKLTPGLKKLDLKSPEYQLRVSIINVAEVFGILYESRMTADYDLNQSVTLQQARIAHVLTGMAFRDWDRVKNDSLAHDYLYTLLFKDRGSVS